MNDLLMTIFFFSVGLEVKGEIVHGELRHQGGEPSDRRRGRYALPGDYLFHSHSGGSVPRLGHSDGYGYRAFVVGCMVMLGIEFLTVSAS